MLQFNNKILFVGYGAVAQCVLPVLLKEIRLNPKNIHVLDFEDKKGALEPWIKKGIGFSQERLSKENFKIILFKHLKSGDILIDLAWSIDTSELLQWCYENGVMYLNTSIEIWDPHIDPNKEFTEEDTLYFRHMNIRKLSSGFLKTGPTAVLEHGANPGLISHFTKQGILDIANQCLADNFYAGFQKEKIQECIAKNHFNLLAKELEIKVIHCSEKDSQISSQPKLVNEFVNTWSIEGFFEEGTAPAELGWGTHEKALPKHAGKHKDGPQNQIYLSKMGIDTWVKSWIPHSSIHGMAIRHGEAFSISDFLTVREGEKVLYRPTVHYAYCPSDVAIASLNELKERDYRLQVQMRIMNDEIVEGEDILGALLMGHPYGAWWTGSCLSIQESRKLVPHQNATTVQVAIGVVSAIDWMIQNPQKGVLFPEDLSHEPILKTAKPYLGKFLSIPTNWIPKQGHTSKDKDKHHLDFSDPWQFKNFLV